MSGSARVVICLCLLGPAAFAAAQPSGATTFPIVDYIEVLRDRGINVIYGSDLLPDSAVMTMEPGDDRGLGSLAAGLRPYRLTVRPGPRDSWLVVPAEADETDTEPATAPSATPPGLTPPPLELVVVSASRYAFARASGPSTTQLDRTQLLHAPALGSDAMRATHGLPGLTSSGLTAHVNVRGGDADESLLYLDGVRLYEPFHLKDFQGLFSSIDPQVVESMSVFTGAYPAEFGDRMSAVIDIEPLIPRRERTFEVGVSTLTSSLFSAGRFNDGRGNWVASVRRGNLDLLIDAARSEAGTPRYTDAFGRLEYELTPSLQAYGGVFALNDKITLNDVGVATAQANYKDNYLWAGARYAGESLDFDVLVSGTDLSGRRSGRIDDPVGSLGSLDDSRDFQSLSIGFDWTWAISESHWLRGGIELRDSEASYLYASERLDRFPIVTAGLARPPTMTVANIDLERDNRSLFITYRARIGDSLTTEIGVRRDQQTLPDDAQTSPRINFLYDVNDKLSIRGSWGRYFQSHGLNELQIGDGVGTLFPAQESEHTVLGVEYLMRTGISVRLEHYRKEFERLRPRFENLFDRVSLLPELQPDRVMIAPLRGAASGVELSAEGEKGDWTWWVNVARARTNDALPSGGADRSWEEPWALKGGLLWMGPRWTVSLAASWHTGWPISNLTLVNGGLVAGPLNEDRLENFNSINVRASRTRVLARGEFEWYLELNNALNKDNPCCIEYSITLDAQSQPQSLSVLPKDWLPIIPTIGFSWRTGHD